MNIDNIQDPLADVAWNKALEVAEKREKEEQEEKEILPMLHKIRKEMYSQNRINECLQAIELIIKLTVK